MSELKVYATLCDAERMVQESEKLRSAFVARLRQALAHAKIPSHGEGARLAKITGKTPKAASKWLNGEAMPGRPSMRAIAQATGVRVEWLQYGEGEMKKPLMDILVDSTEMAYQRIINERKPGWEKKAADIEFSRAICQIGASETSENRSYPEVQPLQRVCNVRAIPIIDYIQAGNPAEVIDTYSAGNGMEMIGVDEWLAEGLGPHAFALKVRGDSMEPEIREGDVVIVDPSAPVRPGNIVVAKVNGDTEATLKKYRARGSDASGEVFELVPLNDDYPTLVVNADHPGRIVGPVVELRKRIYRR